MLSSRPYLARGLYEWLLDNEHTPYIVVDADQPGVRVPRQFVQNGQIVLNIGPTAVRDLLIGNDAVSFHAGFGGQPMQVVVPMPALVAIYARENGVGMVFGHEPSLPAAEEEESASPSRAGPRSVAESHEAEQEVSASTNAEREEAASEKKRPSLRVVK